VNEPQTAASKLLSKAVSLSGPSSLELGGMGPAKKKPQSASAGWGKVIGPYLQAPAPGDSRCSRPQFRPHNFCESMTARQHFP
jgi:hypothetical protein